MSSFFVLLHKLFVIILENQTELFLWLDAIVSTIVMTFRINVDSHQKQQKFIAKIYCNNFSSSNAVVCSHLILANTVRLPIINAAELEQNGCFSIPVLWLKRTSTKSLQVELLTKYDTNDVKKESLVGGVQICEVGVHVHQQIWTGGPNP